MEVGGVALKLIESRLAAADDRAKIGVSKHVALGPKMGYWFRALRFVNEKVLDPNRFAACCFPGKYRSSGIYTFIISHENILHRKDLGREGGVEVFPDDPLKEGWQKVEDHESGSSW